MCWLSLFVGVLDTHVLKILKLPGLVGAQKYYTGKWILQPVRFTKKREED